LKQFQFRSSAEHTINGTQSPLELHMVHPSEPDSTFTFSAKYLPVKEGETKEC